MKPLMTWKPTMPMSVMTATTAPMKRAMNKPAPSSRVTYLGPAGTYTHAAALQWFGKDAQWQPAVDIPEIFAAVESGRADYGVVPVENSSEGSVIPTLDAFNTSALQISGELLLHIRQCLLARAGTGLRDIAKVVSHQQSLGQCRQWLANNLPGIEKVAVSSNAEGARLAGQQPGVAAIAGKTAAELYGLDCIAEGIQDTADNTTRFLLLSRQTAMQRTGRDRTSIIISTLNEPGTLFRALEPFHRFGVNLTKLESRPSRKAAWSYSFYVDFDGHVEDAKVQQALQVLKSHAIDVKLLGSYPAASPH
jgi:chorismate mutase/prephenate dehydratase